MRKKHWLFALALLLCAGLGGLAAYVLREPADGHLVPEVTDVTVIRPPVVPPAPSPPAVPPTTQPADPNDAEASKPPEESCWPQFGRTPAHDLSSPVHLGVPTKHDWVKRMGDYMEYPPVYCDGVLYVNVVKDSRTFAVEAKTGKTLWQREIGGALPSSPAIAGPYLLVSSKGGNVTALRRADGEVIWRLELGANVESSPTVVDNLAYFADNSGRLYGVYWRTGRVKWAYQAGARMNSSPVVWGGRVCNTTYAGSVFCLNRTSGIELWTTHVSRDALRHESFYASASTDGQRLYTLARSGKVVALDLADGEVVWTARQGGYGYTTPAVVAGRVYTGGFDGYVYCYRASTGQVLWRTRLGGRFLGSPVVVGQLVFAANLERQTYALRLKDGRVAWQFGAGKYSPLIATERRYYMALNGLLVSWRGRYSPAG